MKKSLYSLYLAILVISFSLLCAKTTNYIEVNNEQHFLKLKQDPRPHVLEFYADWCGACKRAAPEVKNLAQKHGDIDFLLINTDRNQKLCSEYAINAYPTFVFLTPNGSEIGRTSGFQKEKIEQHIQQIKTGVEKPKPIKKEEPKEVVVEKKEKIEKAKPKEEVKPKKIEPVQKEQKSKPEVQMIHQAGIVYDIASEQEFTKILANKKPAVLDFYTTWCGPCKMMKPILAELAKEYLDVDFIEIDAEKVPSVAKKYTIKAYPTFVFLNAAGEVIDSFSGSRDKSLMKVYIDKAKGKNIKIISEAEVIKMQQQTPAMQKVEPTPVIPAQELQKPTSKKEIIKKNGRKEKMVKEKKPRKNNGVF